MNNFTKLKYANAITGNEEWLGNLVRTIDSVQGKGTKDELINKSREVAQQVFGGTPDYLCEDDFWEVFYEYTDYTQSKHHVSSEWFDCGGVYQELDWRLVDKYCKQLKAQFSQEDNPQNQSEQAKTVASGSTGYIEVLNQNGYKQKDDSSIIAGGKNKMSPLIKWLSGVYKDQKLPDGSSVVCVTNQDILKAKGIDYTKANIWDPRVSQVHEDTKFRLFIRETKISFDIIIKLPLGMEQFDFTSPKAQAEMGVVLGLFTNTDKSKGETFSCNLVGTVAVKKIGYVFRVDDCKYDAVMFTLSKDLLKFKNSNFLVTDYIAACQGATNSFSDFAGELCLGNKIVMGVTPGSLASVVVHTSAPNQLNGCLMSGGAGSGKSAFMDSLLVQSLALDNRDYGRLQNGTKLCNQGNGAVVLLDAKSNEWVKPWKTLINNMGYPLYGFDGCPVSSELLLYKHPKTGKVTNLNFNMPEYSLGICFLSALRFVIRAKYGLIGAKDVVVYNNSSEDKLPRIVILVDELNTIQTGISNSKTYGKMYQKLFMANDTRTANYHWVLAGQNLKASVVSTKDQVNYPYRVLGTMDKEAYEYHGVTVDKAVEEYEAKTEKGSIMSQGMFYFGTKGNTKVIKSMYLPDDPGSRQQALQSINLTGLSELQAVVMWGLQNRVDLFKDNVLNDLYPQNNFVIAALYVTGAINQQQFEYYSKIMLGESEQTYSNEEVYSEEPGEEYNKGHNNEFVAFDMGNQGNPQQSHSQTQQQPVMSQSNQRSMENISLEGLNVEEIPDTNNQKNKKTRKSNNIDFSRLEVEVINNGKSSMSRDGIIDRNAVEPNIVQFQKNSRFQMPKVNPVNIIKNSEIVRNKYRKDLFDDIISSGARTLVSKKEGRLLIMFNREVWINDTIVSGIPEGIEIKDIVSLKVISKRLPYLVELEVDSTVMSALYEVYGVTAIQIIFNTLTRLRTLVIDKSNSSVTITRDEAMAKAIEPESNTRANIEKACNKSNKRNWQFTDLGSKIYGMSLVQDSMSRAKNNIWHSGNGMHPIKAIGWTGLGLATLAVAAPVSAVARGFEAVFNRMRG